MLQMHKLTNPITTYSTVLKIGCLVLTVTSTASIRFTKCLRTETPGSAEVDIVFINSLNCRKIHASDDPHHL